MERVGPAEIRSLAPAVSSRYTCGVYSPDYHHTLDPQAFVGKLFELFQARGGYQVHAKARGLDVHTGRAAGVETADGVLPAGSVVIAAGTGSAEFARQLGEAVPHQAVGGYHVMLGNPKITLETPLLPMDFRFAITPMRAGIRLAGTYDFGAEGRAPTFKLLDDMLSHVVHVLPGINVEKSSVWQGFRSYLPDGLPVISASRAVGGVHYLFGFSSSGMINAAASGRALARMWSGAAPEFDMSPYSIDRFFGNRPAQSSAAANRLETR
jgi:D-amino-acid dehydrogenase